MSSTNEQLEVAPASLIVLIESGKESYCESLQQVVHWGLHAAVRIFIVLCGGSPQGLIPQQLRPGLDNAGRGASPSLRPRSCVLYQATKARRPENLQDAAQTVSVIGLLKSFASRQTADQLPGWAA